jgi:hypothetical protein
MGMSQRPKKEKNADELGKEEQTYGTRDEEGGGNGGFNASDMRDPDAGDLRRNPRTGEPTVSRTTKDDDSDSKGSRTKFENGFVDSPGGRWEASDVQASAKPDASPGQAPNPVKEGRPGDARSSG